jgi:hypothetical protein
MGKKGIFWEKRGQGVLFVEFLHIKIGEKDIFREKKVSFYQYDDLYDVIENYSC